jgi:uncharacterized protein (TIGR02246 family)
MDTAGAETGALQLLCGIYSLGLMPLTARRLCAHDSMVALKLAQRMFYAVRCLKEDFMSGWRLLTLAALCCAALSCRRDTRADDEAAIRAATREWNAAEAARDVERCVSFYAEDGERFAAGSPLIRGIDGLRKEWRKYVLSPGTFQWTTSRVEVSTSGDLAYETGKFVLKTVDKNGQTSTTNGKYVCVWRKQSDGKWKVIADIDNPDS